MKDGKFHTIVFYIIKMFRHLSVVNYLLFFMQKMCWFVKFKKVVTCSLILKEERTNVAYYAIWINAVWDVP